MVLQDILGWHVTISPQGFGESKRPRPLRFLSPSKGLCKKAKPVCNLSPATLVADSELELDCGADFLNYSKGSSP